MWLDDLLLIGLVNFMPFAPVIVDFGSNFEEEITTGDQVLIFGDAEGYGQRLVGVDQIRILDLIFD